MSNRIKRNRTSNLNQEEANRQDTTAETNQDFVVDSSLQQGTQVTVQKCRGLLKLPISSWIESKNKNGSTASMLFDSENTYDANALIVDRSVGNSVSDAYDDAAASRFPGSLLANLRGQTTVRRKATEVNNPEDIQVARIARKREINRQSAQRKRQREKDQLEFLSEKHTQLRFENEELKRDRKKLMEMTEMVKSGKIVSMEPIAASSSSVPDSSIPKLSAALDCDIMTSSDHLSRPDTLRDLLVVNASVQYPAVSGPAIDWRTQAHDLLTRVAPDAPIFSLSGVPQATCLSSSSSTGSMQQLVVLLLAVLLQGKPEMVQILKEFIDNEVARQRHMEEERQKQLKMNLENSTSMSILMGMLLQHLLVPSGNILHSASQNSKNTDRSLAPATASIPSQGFTSAPSERFLYVTLQEK